MKLALLDNDGVEECSVEIDEDWYNYLLSMYGGSAYDKDGATVPLNDPRGVLNGYFMARCCPTNLEDNNDFLSWKAKQVGWSFYDVVRRGLDALNKEINAAKMAREFSSR